MLICYVAEIARQISGGKCDRFWKVMDGIILKKNY
jgi:hypothetical protein